jgi:hypothetical protein
MQYIIKRSIVGKNVLKIEVFSGTDRVKLIMHSVHVKAEQQLTYYLDMMRGVNAYTEWLNHNRV